MRKMKKINGYFVVRFNDRERREYEGTALGNYGVIDAELYTGCLDADRSVMEYDGAETLEEAIEQARDLESELDVEEPSATYTIVTETNEHFKEEIIKPQLMIAGWETTLEQQIEDSRFPEVNPLSARHQLYGYMVALRDLGIYDSDKCLVEPYHFNQEQTPPLDVGSSNMKVSNFAATLTYLKECRDMAVHNLLCSSSNYAMSEPKPGCIEQWNKAGRDIELVEELIGFVERSKGKEPSYEETAPSCEDSIPWSPGKTSPCPYSAYELTRQKRE